jgi:hypothetical protein
MSVTTRYAIGDKLHCYLHSDYDFEMEVEIQGIASFEVADKQENIFRKLFNSNTSYEEVLATTSYFYICKVLTATVNYAVGDTAVLCDPLIKTESYFIANSFRLIIDIEYDTHNTTYRNELEVVAGLEDFMTSKGLTSNVSFGKTDAELQEDELNTLRAFLNEVKGLQSLKPTIDELKSLNSTDIYNRLNAQILILISMATNLIKALKENTP